MNPKICVIGCGWLGFPLAKTLVNSGYQVHGTTTSEAKLTRLQQSGIVPFLVEITSEGITGAINTCLSECNTVVINIPPGLRKDPENQYVQKMTHLIEAIEKASIRTVLFIGSTSVYADEEHFPLITERSETSTSKTALKLLAVENRIQNSKNFRSTILRFSGLFAEDRHPARFLSGRTGIKNPKAPINLIHRDDCISIILRILQKDIWNMVLNASTTVHPTKRAYYASVCERFDIPIPEFDDSTKSKGKTIDATTLKQVLDYKFSVNIPSV